MENIPILHTTSSLDLWLDSRINYNDYDDKPDIYKSEYNNISFYYNISDIELSMKNNYLKETYKKYNEDNSYLDLTNQEDKDIYDRMKYIQCYTNGNKMKLIYIDPFTNRYIVDMLFRKLIDSSQDIICPNNVPLISTNMRKSFYKFCYEHSKY